MTPPLPITCIHVGPLYNQGPTLIQDGVDAIVGFGFDSIGLFLSPNYSGSVSLDGHADYPLQTWGSTPTNLTQLIQTPGFSYVINHPSLRKVFLKTWTFYSGIFVPQATHVYTTDLQGEYDEMKALAIYLLQNTSNKEFIIQTSESDFDYMQSVVPTTPIPKNRAQMFIAFYQARLRAIKDARREAGSSTSRIFCAVELNRVLDDNRRLHKDVIPNLSLDMVGLSIYEATSDWYFLGLNQAQALVAIDTQIRLVVQKVRTEYAKVHGNEIAAKLPIFLGEWGFPEKNTRFIPVGDLDPTALARQVLETAADLGLYSANFWQLWCNDLGPAGGVAPGVITDQCIQKEDNSFTYQGTYLLSLLS